ncbi:MULTISPECIES: tetratricopeptide repeat protein [unclassified Tenacibaculum]|uniref:tetratricopeptide repeat protein n=1 Tax=unclassified Tenacibaculum TaxID=2635139 RepID=UPI001F461763|nr:MULTISPECIES: tetratricopeptide repeat protein [unclassified Tenacibaculum]MCF2874892.1 tetratricopeptide repeat protein [Tenacibaculum sp. Cn5-1]MCF2934042.1 tetratricopeptide repeat protein [Tenacibaculum sp. Cn5-34]MCG7510252.1 tetratricopeptide repeat protein [Tenacibaculum sp. Cn5-46]
MKKILLGSFFLISCIISAQQINKTTLDSKGRVMLLGKTNKKAFETKDFSWFQKNYEDYITNKDVIKEFKEQLKDYTIKVFYGSWCGDSKRGVPKFYKVLDEAGYDLKNLDAIAVDRKPEAYKASPNGEEKGLNIHRVPTFIFYKNNREVGRIVESPKQDYERDMLAITQGKRYAPQYIVAENLHSLMNFKSLEDLKKEEEKLIVSFAEFTKGSRELNTFGYKLLRSKQIEKALFVFQLNTKMYPYKYNVFDSLGEAYYTNKNYEKSLQSYQKVLKLKPNDENAIEMIEKIKKEMI